MGMVFQGIQGLAGLASLVCFILVVVAMFQRNQTTLGIVCIVLVFCGIGGLIAFVYGWMKANEWNLKNVMIIWTIAIVIGIIGGVGGVVMTPGLR
jgi:hypothetical protein